MGQLGDKTYNVEYYGEPTMYRPEGRTAGNANQPSFMALTPRNVYSNYQGDWASRNGKPLDESIALFHMPANCSFAGNAAITIATGDILLTNKRVTPHDSPVPVAMMLADNTSASQGFDTNPKERLGYGLTFEADYVHSPLIYDIDPTCVCIFMGILGMNTTTGTHRGYSLSDVENFSDTEIVTALRPYINGGTSTARMEYRDTTSNMIIPAERIGETEYGGVPVMDTLSDRPIPDNEEVRDYINDYGHPDWNREFTYSPFTQAIVGASGANIAFFYNEEVITSQDQHAIGYSFTQSVQNIKNGRYNIPDTSTGVSMRYYRCNYETHSFDDVVYQWVDRVYDATTHEFLEQGTDISNLPNSRYLRFCTVLEIVDSKGASRGVALQRAILHEYAYLGFYFTPIRAAATSAKLGADASATDLSKLYLPIFSNGTTTGLYVTGEDIRTAPNADSNTFDDEVYHYDPDSGESDSGSLNTRIRKSYLAGSTHCWGMTQGEFRALMRWLNTTYQPVSVDDEGETTDDLTVDFKGSNPCDYIVSACYFPFDVPVRSYQDNVLVGPVDTGLDGYPCERFIGEDDYGYYDLGTILCDNRILATDFRLGMYKLIAYIPWCGFTELDPWVFGRSPDGSYNQIQIKLSIDFATGSCMGLIFRVQSSGEATLIQTVNGTCGVQVPLTAINQGAYQDTIKQTELALESAQRERLLKGLQLAGSMVGAAFSAATGNLAGAAMSVYGLSGGVAGLEQAATKIDSLEYQLDHTAPSVGICSGASPFNNILIEPQAKLLIFKPAMLDRRNWEEKGGREIYAQTVGHACVKQGSLSNFSGFTVCSNFNLSGLGTAQGEAAPTAEELSALSSLLTSGIII